MAGAGGSCACIAPSDASKLTSSGLRERPSANPTTPTIRLPSTPPSAAGPSPSSVSAKSDARAAPAPIASPMRPAPARNSAAALSTPPAALNKSRTPSGPLRTQHAIIAGQFALRAKPPFHPQQHGIQGKNNQCNFCSRLVQSSPRRRCSISCITTCRNSAGVSRAISASGINTRGREKSEYAGPLNFARRAQLGDARNLPAALGTQSNARSSSFNSTGLRGAPSPGHEKLLPQLHAAQQRQAAAHIAATPRLQPRLIWNGAWRAATTRVRGNPLPAAHAKAPPEKHIHPHRGPRRRAEPRQQAQAGIRRCQPKSLLPSRRNQCTHQGSRRIRTEMQQDLHQFDLLHIVRSQRDRIAQPLQLFGVISSSPNSDNSSRSREFPKNLCSTCRTSDRPASSSPTHELYRKALPSCR